MSYRVIWPDGRKFGPADEALLLEWLREGRITAETELEDEDTGERLNAGDLPSLKQVAGEQSKTFTAPPNPTQGSYYREAPNSASSSEITLSIICSIGGFFFSFILCFCCPFGNIMIFCFPLYGLNLANKAMAAGHPSAGAARVVAIVCLVLSILIALFFFVITILEMSSNGAIGWRPFIRINSGGP